MTWSAAAIRQSFSSLAQTRIEKRKLENQNLSLGIHICGETKKESTSEKLLGVVINNTATFKHHLYGDEENKGLPKQLSTRVGMMKKLKKHLPPGQLRVLMDGLFNSKMLYGITVAAWMKIRTLELAQA